MDTADLLRGDAALLEEAKKGELPRVQKLASKQNINCRDTQVCSHTRPHMPSHLVMLNIDIQSTIPSNLHVYAVKLLCLYVLLKVLNVMSNLSEYGRTCAV